MLSTIYAKFANIDYSITEQMEFFFMADYYTIVLFIIMLVPEANVSILRITVCTILDNDGIPTCDDSDDLLDFSN